ncbi:MAG: FtsX-like permease family protein, partial [Gemmatimonadales bacterium]
VFAGSALLLGAIGVYGVLSYGVSSRRQEFGVRLAVGAAPGRVMGMVVGQALLLVAVGLGIGFAGALALAGLLERFVFGVSARDPLTFALVALVFLSMGALAGYLPARRATRIPATEALQAE